MVWCIRENKMKCKILIARLANKNIYCGDKILGKKMYCSRCQAAQQNKEITKQKICEEN
jgi:hypothetical protein